MPVVGLHLEYRMAGVNVGESVLERMSFAYERAGDELKDFQKHIFDKLPPIFEAEMERQIDAGGGGPSGPFEPLTDAYAKWKEQAFPGNPILVASGKLREGLTNSSSIYATRSTDAETFNFGTQDVPYASYHQVGTSHMPARPPFDFSPDFEADVEAAALEGVRDAVKSAGLDQFAELRP